MSSEELKQEIEIAVKIIENQIDGGCDGTKKT